MLLCNYHFLYGRKNWNSFTVVCLFLLLESNVLPQLQTDKCEKLTAVIRVLFVFFNIIYLRAIEHGFMRSDEIELTKRCIKTNGIEDFQ